MKFKRLFAKTKGQPYDGLKFVERTSELKTLTAVKPAAK